MSPHFCPKCNFFVTIFQSFAFFNNRMRITASFSTSGKRNYRKLHILSQPLVMVTNVVTLFPPQTNRINICVTFLLLERITLMASLLSSVSFQKIWQISVSIWTQLLSLPIVLLLKFSLRRSAIQPRTPTVRFGFLFSNFEL